jgi:hypothetical protein
MTDFSEEQEKGNKMADQTDDIEYVVTKTTTEMFVAVAANAEEAEKAVADGNGELVQRNTSNNVRPRNMAPVPTARSLATGPTGPP